MGTRLVVNGRTVESNASPDSPLLWVLRDELGQRSAKYGCGLEQCGACRVLIDGTPRASCLLPIGDLDGHSVTTLEALVDEPAGQAVVAALLARNAGQCGYCLPGIAVTLTSLVARGEPMTRREIAAALDPHLCRCGSQPRIMQAALELLSAAETGK